MGQWRSEVSYQADARHGVDISVKFNDIRRIKACSRCVARTRANRRAGVRESEGDTTPALEGWRWVLKGGKDTIFQSGDKEQACLPLAN